MEKGRKSSETFDSISPGSSTISPLRTDYTKGLSARKAQKRQIAKYQHTVYQNPAFDGSYDTFTEGTPGITRRGTEESGPVVHSVDPSTDFPIQVDPDYDEGEHQMDNLRAEAVAEDLATNILTEELPSTTLRRMKGLARPGTVKHRGRGEKFNALEDDDPSSILPSSSMGTFGRGEAFNRKTLQRMASHQLEVEDLDDIDTANVRNMTVGMNTKKSVRRQASRIVEPKTISSWKQFKYNVSLNFKRFSDSVKDSFAYVDLWHSHLKTVQGTFGTGVLSYFILLRWVFVLNLFITILNGTLLFVPQVVHDPSTDHNNVSFTGLELLTGEGWFERTELYYGSYTNESIPVKGASPYRMPLAYLFVGGGYLLLCLFILVVSMAKSYRDNFILSGDSGGSLKYFTKVFCTWDYAVTDTSAVLLKKKSIYNDLLETLSEARGRRKVTTQERCCLILVRILTNLAVLGLLAGSAYVILFVADGSVKVNTSFLQDMLPAIVISGLNLIIPFAFRIVASMESYSSPKTEIAVSLGRTILLKLASISVYVVALHKDVTCSVKKSSSCKQINCWETFVGMAFYKLVVVDFIFLLISVFFGEFLRRILASYIPSCKDKIGIPGFDISRNVLDLIYGQGICWLGTFYCPLLPLVNVIKIFILFYIKRYSVMRNCRPSMRPFNASKMNLLFLALLGLMLVLAMVVIGYVIINDGDLKPSVFCGPFRGQPKIFKVVVDVIDNDIPDFLEDAIEGMSSTSVLTALLFLLALLAYYFKLKKSSGEKKIKLLKEQIALAGRDKLFLIRKLRLVINEAAQQVQPLPG